MGLLAFIAALVLLVAVLLVIVYVALSAGDTRPIERTGSAEEADREAKARSYGIDHLSGR